MFHDDPLYIYIHTCVLPRKFLLSIWWDNMALTLFFVCIMIRNCISIAKQCDSGNIIDSRSGNNNIINWEVCQVRDNQAWVQHGTNYGAYNMLSICQSLGYESVTHKRNTNGYRCGNITGYSCNNSSNWDIFFPEGQWEYNSNTEITSTKSSSKESSEKLKSSINCCHIAWICENNVNNTNTTIAPIQDIMKKKPKTYPKWITLILIITVAVWICLIIVIIYMYILYKKGKQEAGGEIVIHMNNIRSSSPSQTAINAVLPPKPTVIETPMHYLNDNEGDQSKLRRNTNANDEGIQIVYAGDKILNTKTKPVI